MKKFYKYMVLMLLLAVGFFYGCSKNADIQTTPTELSTKYNANYLDIKSDNSGENNGKEELLAMKFAETERLNILKGTIDAIKNDIFQAISPQKKKVLINKLETVALMYHTNNYQGAIKKLECDILPKIKNAFFDENEGIALKKMLGFQKVLLKNPEIPADTNFVINIACIAPIIVAAIITAAAAIGAAIISKIGASKCSTGQNHAGKGGDTFLYPNNSICAHYGKCSCYITPICTEGIK